MMKTHILMPIMISMTSYYHDYKLNSRLSAVLTFIHKTLLVLIVVTIASIVSSCEEDPTNIGEALFPGSDFVTVKTTDTLSVFAFTDYHSPVRTNNSFNSYLGKISDPYFGETTSDFVAQLQLLGAWPGGGAFTVDSVKFFLTVLRSEGSFNSQQYINLSESTDFMSEDSVYYSDRVVHAGPAFGGIDFGTYPLPAVEKDSATTLVIDLPIFVGKYLMRDTTMLLRSSTEPDFRTFFKGLYVNLIDSPDPLFLTTWLSGEEPGASIYVYYHSNKDGIAKVYPFWINRNCVSFNRYTHNFNTALPEKKILHRNERIRDSVSYLQNYEGVFTRIEIPGLKDIKTLMPISVNKARLKLPVFFDSDSVIFKTATLPSMILIRYKTAEGIMDTVPDFDLSSSYLGGIYNKTTKEYTFNLAIFTQLYLEGKIPDPVIELFLPAGTSKNVIFRMNENSKHAKLEFTYTKF
jgi:hypothetical protein